MIDVQRRRHRHKAQIVAERACSVERQGKRKVVVEAALVHLVEHLALKRRPTPGQPECATGKRRESW